MKSLRSILVLLLSMATLLMVAHSAAAMGGRGATAAVVIDKVLLINPNHRADHFITAEIDGGGFLGGNFVGVTLNGDALAVTETTRTMIIAKIPQNTPDGDYTLTVTTGNQSKQTASTTIGLGGEMIVSCISWFVSGPQDEHVHTEVHVEDENGNAIIGAIVTWTSRLEDLEPYQTNVSATGDRDGHATVLTTCPLDGNGEPDVSGSGVTDWFCCIGAGKFDGEIPGKRACDAGDYTAEIIDVTAPPQTNMVWNQQASELEATITLDPMPQ